MDQRPADDLLPAWSPNGRRIAFVSTRDGNPEIYVMDQDGQNLRRLTFNPGGDWRPAWLPDSQRLVFTSDRRGSNDIYLLTVPPSGDTPLTAEPPLTSLVTRPSDDRDPAIGGSGLLSTYFDFDFGPAGYLFFLSDRDGGQKSYVTTPEGSAVTAERFADNDLVEAHPSWFKEYTLLVAVGQDEASEIYALTPFSPPKVLTESPGFDGQPAGGPVGGSRETTSGRYNESSRY
jgi:Tol biopolymer transport system component